MPTHRIRRGSTLLPGETGQAQSSPIYVDSDIDQLKIVPASTGSTEKTIADLSTAQTFTNKTFTAPTITSPTITSPTITAPSVVDSAALKVLAASITYDSKPAAAVITGFAWTVTAAGVYVLDAILYTTMTTTGGLTVSFKLTTATLTSIAYDSYAATASDNTTAVSTQGTTTTDATAIFDSKTAAYTLVRVRGSFVVNAGGTFSLFATQNTSGTGGDVSIIKIGSFASLRQAA